MSSWIEPTRDFINTLVQAKNLASSESLQEIPQFLTKIGTNHLISAKTISFDFREPYGFTAGVLGSIPNPAGGSAGGFSDSDPNFSELPIWCPHEESNLNYYLRKVVSYPLNDEGNILCAIPNATPIISLLISVLPYRIKQIPQ